MSRELRSWSEPWKSSEFAGFAGRRWLAAFSEGDVYPGDDQHVKLGDERNDMLRTNRPFSGASRSLPSLGSWRNGPFGWVSRSYLTPGPYLKHVRSLLPSFGHLQLLADFMDVGTIPTRWLSDVPGGYPEDLFERQPAHLERTRRTRVCCISYCKNGDACASEVLDSSEKLHAFLNISNMDENSQLEMKLFVVEDLSRDVIETLGGHFDIDPSFFQAHLVDSTSWNSIRQSNFSSHFPPLLMAPYGPRAGASRAQVSMNSKVAQVLTRCILGDWWYDPPPLKMVSSMQSWFQLRYMRARFFPSTKALERGIEEAMNFNLFRPLEEDHWTSQIWDNSGPHNETTVGLMRTRVSYWLQPRPHQLPSVRSTRKSIAQVGVIVLDPTPRSGNPLWVHTRNWAKPPSLLSCDGPPNLAPPSDNEFDEYIYWATRPEQFDPDFGFTELTTAVAVHLICTKWLTMADYLETRLTQVESMIHDDDGPQFTSNEDVASSVTKLLHMQQEIIHYQEMLRGTLFDLSLQKSSTRLGTQLHPSPLPPVARSQDYGLDLRRVLHRVEGFYARIGLTLNYLKERGTGTEHQQSYRKQYSHSVKICTWLLFIFLPLILVAKILSITSEARKVWFEIGVPLLLLVGTWKASGDIYKQFRRWLSPLNDIRPYQ